MLCIITVNANFSFLKNWRITVPKVSPAQNPVSGSGKLWKPGKTGRLGWMWCCASLIYTPTCQLSLGQTFLGRGIYFCIEEYFLDFSSVYFFSGIFFLGCGLSCYCKMPYPLINSAAPMLFAVCSLNLIMVCQASNNPGLHRHFNWNNQLVHFMLNCNNYFYSSPS